MLPVGLGAEAWCIIAVASLRSDYWNEGREGGKEGTNRSHADGGCHSGFVVHYNQKPYAAIWTVLQWLCLEVKSNQSVFVTCAEYNRCRPYSEMLNTTGVVDLTVKCLLTGSSQQCKKCIRGTIGK
jgi:hypothetical protein